ncbi:MAG TPA: hypothetical protein VGQ83_29400 [Polyangia bacterium]|jgi:hypothetical protein
MSLTRVAIVAVLGLALLGACRRPRPPAPRPAARAPAAAPASRPAAPLARQANVWIAGDRLQVGYGTDVVIRAVAAPGTPPLRYRWDQAGGPDVRGTMRVDGATLRFKTRPLAEMARARRTFGPLPLAANEVGVYGFRLYAEGSGLYAVVPFEVRSAETDGEWPRAVPGRDRYLTCGGGPGPWRWVISQKPKVSQRPLLAAGDTCTPRFRPDVHGLYEITEEVSRRKLTIDVGPWFGATDCGRAECHPREHDRWARTPHATIVQRGVDGQIPGYTVACLRCHAVGALEQNLAAKGFDEAVAKTHWPFPSRPAPGSWAQAPAELRSVMAVGCDNCHGPGFYWTGWGVAACARCHDAPPRYVRFQEWRQSRAASDEPLPATPRTTQAPCTRCHTAQGFVEWARRDAPPKRDWKQRHPVPPGAAEAFGRILRDLTPQSPHTCLACHAPHPAQASHRQLRQAPPGTPHAWLGLGQLCAACHRQPPGRSDDQAPHGAIEADYLSGDLAARAGVDATRPSHAKVPGGCVGCHMARPRSWRRGDPALARGGHTFKAARDGEVCRGCHAQGAPAVLDTAAELAGLRTAIDAAVRARTGAVTFDVRDERMVLVDGAGAARPIADAALRRAVYGYLALKADRSHGVHNPGLTRRLLRQAGAAVGR